MAAPKGNRFWEARSSHGRNPKFASPEELWSACVEYFEWAEEHPLYETKAFHNQGDIVYAQIPKIRAMTIAGLCLFLDITEKTWANYRVLDDFLQVITHAEQIIYDQKFSGAAADLLNANIIARDLGLRDKQEVDNTSSDGSMSGNNLIVTAADLSDEQLANIISSQHGGSSEGAAKKKASKK